MIIGSAAKVRRVNAAHQGSPGSQDQMERKASSSRGTTSIMFALENGNANIRA